MMATEAEQQDCYQTTLKVARDAGKVRIKPTYKSLWLSLASITIDKLFYCVSIVIQY